MAKKVSVEKLRKLTKETRALKTVEVSYKDVEFEVKQYLPIEHKRVIVELIARNSFVYDEDSKLHRFESTIKEAMLGYFITKEYTNFNIVSDPFEMYDLVKSTGVLDVIIEAIPHEEVIQLEAMVEDRIAEEYRIQELNTSIGHKIEDTLVILNRKMSEAINAMTNFDPKQLEMLTSFLNEDQKAELNIVDKEEEEEKEAE